MKCLRKEELIVGYLKHPAINITCIFKRRTSSTIFNDRNDATIEKPC
jgi:hypothetical protein